MKKKENKTETRMKNTSKLLTILVTLLCISPVFGQETIHEVDLLGNNSLIKWLNNQQSVLCSSDGSFSQLSLIEDDSNSCQTVLFKGNKVFQITDFEMTGNKVAVCGMVLNDSSWFMGFIPSITASSPYLIYLSVPNVSRLAKIRWMNSHMLVAGDDLNGRGILYEADLYTSYYYNLYTASLIDTITNYNYSVDDMLILENYIVVSSHVKQTIGQTFPPRGHIWFIDKPTSPGIHINHPTIYFFHANTYYDTWSPIYLEKHTSTRFLTAGTGISNTLTKHAMISRYVEKTHYRTLKLPIRTGAEGLSYNPQSNKIEMLTSTSGSLPFSTTYNKVYTFNSDLTVNSTGTIYGHQFDGYRLNSITPYGNTAYRFLISGYTTSDPYKRVDLLRYKSNYLGSCSSQISTTVEVNDVEIEPTKTRKSSIVYTVRTTTIDLVSYENDISPECGVTKE